MEERNKKLGPQAVFKNFKKFQNDFLGLFLAILMVEKIEKMGKYGEMGERG